MSPDEVIILAEMNKGDLRKAGLKTESVLKGRVLEAPLSLMTGLIEVRMYVAGGRGGRVAVEEAHAKLHSGS